MEAKAESIAPKGSAVRASKLRYPLRSAMKSKEVNDQPVSKRSAKPIADITKSVSVLELSGKDKLSAKPPRRLSNPAKSVSTPRTSIGPATTPSSIRSSVLMTETPGSNMSGSTIARRKFSMISSVSYWMAQIKLAEAASKHSISLGFFKLSLEVECEPLDRMREELKSYIVRHNLSVALLDSVKDILDLFGITEDPEELKASINIKSDSPKSNTKSEKSSKTTPVMPSSKRNGNLKPRSLNTEVGKKTSNAGSKVRVSSNKNPVKSVVVKENHKKVIKDEGDGEKKNQTSLENNPYEGSATIVDSTSNKLEASYEEEKENMENAPIAEISAE